jgi:hypothetical protein
MDDRQVKEAIQIGLARQEDSLFWIPSINYAPVSRRYRGIFVLIAAWRGISGKCHACAPRFMPSQVRLPHPAWRAASKTIQPARASKSREHHHCPQSPLKFVARRQILRSHEHPEHFASKVPEYTPPSEPASTMMQPPVRLTFRICESYHPICMTCADPNQWSPVRLGMN